jgi:inner membrane protein involved in colicin E2 resistance
MKRLIEFPLEDGSTIMVEVDESKVEDGLVPVSTKPGEVEKAQTTFEAAVSKIRPVAESVINTLHDIPKRPDEIELEFGLKLNGKTGIYIASVGNEVNFQVRLTWKQED